MKTSEQILTYLYNQLENHIKYAEIFLTNNDIENAKTNLELSKIYRKIISFIMEEE